MNKWKYLKNMGLFGKSNEKSPKDMVIKTIFLCCQRYVTCTVIPGSLILWIFLFTFESTFFKYIQNQIWLKPVVSLFQLCSLRYPLHLSSVDSIWIRKNNAHDYVTQKSCKWDGVTTVVWQWVISPTVIFPAVIGCLSVLPI